MTNETYRILESRMNDLKKAFDKLNKKADKMDCPHVSYSIVESEMIPDPYVIQQILDTTGANPSEEALKSLPHVKVNHIAVHGTGPKIEGFKFIGTLDHHTLPGKVIVQSVPGETVPVQFFHVEAICNHCNKIRVRSETFILENLENGSYLQVGRSCLKDFFGHDPKVVVGYLTRLFKLLSSFGDSETWGSAGSGAYQYYDKVKVLVYTAAVIRTYGWSPKSNYNGVPTVNIVGLLLSPGYSDADRREQTIIRKEINDAAGEIDSDENLAVANSAIAWLNAKDNSNSYMHNLKVLNEGVDVPVNMLGYWCSVISAYQREVGKVEYAKTDKKINEHYGTVGGKPELTVKCVDIRYISSHYGTTTIHNMLSDEGHSLVWFSTSGKKMEVGKTYNIKGTIKAHNEFKGWAQTAVTRVKVL